MPYKKPPHRGHVAEWLRNGLQNRVHQFNSGRGLHISLILLSFKDRAAAHRPAKSERSRRACSARKFSITGAWTTLSGTPANGRIFEADRRLAGLPQGGT